jgi:hypothetical protein
MHYGGMYILWREAVAEGREKSFLNVAACGLAGAPRPAPFQGASGTKSLGKETTLSAAG